MRSRKNVSRKVSARQIQAMETKQKIYDVAVSLFLQDGYENVSIDEICRTVGVTKGSFYSHFESKEQIVLERVFCYIANYRDELFPQVAALKPGMEKLTAFGRLIIKHIIQSDKKMVKTAYRIPLGDIKKPLIALTDEHEIYEIIESIIIEGQSNGDLRKDLPSSQIAFLAWCFLRGLVYTWCLPKSKVNIETMSESMFDVLRAGIQEK